MSGKRRDCGEDQLAGAYEHVGRLDHEFTNDGKASCKTTSSAMWRRLYLTSVLLALYTVDMNKPYISDSESEIQNQTRVMLRGDRQNIHGITYLTRFPFVGHTRPVVLVVGK